MELLIVGIIVGLIVGMILTSLITANRINEQQGLINASRHSLKEAEDKVVQRDKFIKNNQIKINRYNEIKKIIEIGKSKNEFDTIILSEIKEVIESPNSNNF